MAEVLHVEAQGPLRHCWGSGNRILVHSASGVRNVSDPEDLLYEVKWGVSLTSNEFMRRLVKTSYDVFCALQYNTNPERCASFSVQYRAALTVCSQEILQFLKLSVDIDDAKASHLMAQCEIVLRLELIWHLAELIFLQSFPEGHLAYNLCSWFHVQSQEAADNARLLIDLHGSSSAGRSSLVRPEEDERFWPTVLALVLQARPHEAASLLAIHSYANSRGLRSLRQLLVAMPIASHNTKNKGTWRNSGAAFSQAWNYWQSECRRRLSGGEFDHTGNDAESTQYVKLIVSILAGSSASWDDPVILLVTGGSRAWYFRFVSFLFYTNQLVTMDELSGHLDAWLNGRGISDGESDSDLDQSFVRVSCEKLESWWLVAHFTNLLHRTYPDVLCSTGSSESTGTFRAKPEDHAEVSSIQNQQSEFSVVSRDRRSPSLPDFFLIGYAESLACDLGLLPVALGYLDFCENGSFRQSALLLRHACPVSTRAVNWFLSQARSRSLHETSKQLAGIATRRFLPLVLHDFDKASGNVDKIIYNCLPSCATIGWALMARDLGIVARIAEHTLARDKGFCVESPSEDQCPHPTEIAEMAAIVLGFCSDQALRNVPPSQSFQPANSLSELCLSSELAFLVRYAKLQQCFASGDIETAVDRLIDLLITGSGSSSAVELGAASCGSGSLISTRLRLRLLTEVRHLLGRRCVRRDQAELLISALVDLRLDTCDDPTEDNKKLNALLVHIHILLAQELTSSLLVRESQINDMILGSVV
ncbi:Nucleoporin nup85 [Clonorchis sinensis]|uniref:Nuclear pore complex protein Nup85 n=1 Tax=Clonorchis sinensis TaxID=79923 RepID=A0A8T1MRI4_CLOSI|nr:Nucleoporin nup85 [Clonorchis sinensis]